MRLVAAMKVKTQIRNLGSVKVTRAKRLMNVLAQEPDVFSVEPWLFYCRRCHLKWRADLPMNIALEQVTCSNCYSDNVAVVNVKVTAWEISPHFKPTAAEAIDEYNALKKRRRAK